MIEMGYSMVKQRVVIIGGGQAGGQTALSLREGGHCGQVVVVAAEPRLPYERPPLSKEILTGEAEPDTALLADARRLSELRIDVLKGVAATAIHTNARQVQLADGRLLDYDDLVLTTGSKPRRLAYAGHTGMLPVLRDMDDALTLRDRLQAGVRLVVVGGGVIGLELASSALTRGVRPVVIEAANWIMARQIGPAASALLAALHRAAGTDLFLGRSLRAVDRQGEEIVLTLADGIQVRADVAIAAIGVVPDTALAEAAGIACDDGILVDALGRTSHPGIWAAGDVARGPVGWADWLVRQETWRNADIHARRVAAAILGATDGGAGNEVPGFWSDQLGHRLQAEGQCLGEEIVRAQGGAGDFASFYLHGGRLVGCVVLDNPKFAALARRAIARMAEPDPAALADPATDLRQALR